MQVSDKKKYKCITCKTPESVSNRTSRCPPCRRAATHREKLYGELRAIQGPFCALCGNPEPPGRKLCVDHCHQTGIIRKLLCDRCNTALGLLDDSPERADDAAKYLRLHSLEPSCRLQACHVKHSHSSPVTGNGPSFNLETPRLKSTASATAAQRSKSGDTNSGPDNPKAAAA